MDPELLPKLNMSWAYKNDFEMFNYSFDQYLQNFNIKLWSKSRSKMISYVKNKLWYFKMMQLKYIKDKRLF